MIICSRFFTKRFLQFDKNHSPTSEMYMYMLVCVCIAKIIMCVSHRDGGMLDMRYRRWSSITDSC